MIFLVHLLLFILIFLGSGCNMQAQETHNRQTRSEAFQELVDQVKSRRERSQAFEALVAQVALESEGKESTKNVIISTTTTAAPDPSRAESSEERPSRDAGEQASDMRLVRKEVSFDQVNQGRLMVALTFGQSQAANYGETKHSSAEHVYNYYNGTFYTAVDPLLGATGHRGSVWTRLGDKLIKQGLYDSVLFVPIAVGGSGIRSWSPDGHYGHRITDAVDGLRAYGLECTHLFWSQGSYDSWQHTPEAAEAYKASFIEMVEGIRAYGVCAPIYVSVETYSYGNSDSYMQQAQRDLVNIDAGIFSGPDSDAIDKRWDDVHFSEKGLDALASLWLAAIKEYH